MCSYTREKGKLGLTTFIFAHAQNSFNRKHFLLIFSNIYVLTLRFWTFIYFSRNVHY